MLIAPNAPFEFGGFLKSRVFLAPTASPASAANVGAAEETTAGRSSLSAGMR